MINKILVPTDGSERAEKAAEYAIEVARDNDASIFFLSVVDELSPAYAYETEAISPTLPEILDQMKEAADNYVDQLQQRAAQAGVKATTKVVTGHPSEEILNQADDSGADLIVISSHGRRALAAAVIGSVTINVIHGARIPVTVVPWHKE